jgi:hypothetical protein
MNCPNCLKLVLLPIPQNEKGEIFCHRCETLFSKPADFTISQPEYRKQADFQVKEVGNELIISWSWFQLQDNETMAYKLVVVLFLFILLGAMLQSILLEVDGNLGWMIVTVLVLGLVYALLCKLLNRTELRIKDSQISIQFGPLPWLPKRGYASSLLHKLSVKESQIKIKKRRTNKWKTIKQGRYEMWTHPPNQKKMCLVKDIPNYHQAIYISDQIEKICLSLPK